MSHSCNSPTINKQVMLIKIMKKPEIFVYTDLFDKNHNKFVKSVLHEIPFFKSIGFAGFRKKSNLRYFLKWSKNKPGKAEFKDMNKKDTKDTVQQALKLCSSMVGNRKIYVFVFPDYDGKPELKNLGGAKGFSTWNNTIIISVYPVRGWRKQLRETVCHELTHALTPDYHKNPTIGDWLVYDGIAEHFSEHFAGGKSQLLVITKTYAKKIVSKIRTKLNKKDEKFHAALFYAGKKYPIWAGYAIGYYIVQDWLRKQKNIDWERILKMKPEKILKESDWVN